ncbi:hypothetical protein HMPREF9389_2097 [Streptococcus sanguinis SK355]|uniref:Uncharacterized protein n=1 Tax=Streptococcus sanguinis SK355 TaxID=888816 RepID=F3UTD9_STRSA|nr:hypothetical protein HMPREF9389_2097 [Streptococcus sanguinis SK355]
MFFTPFFQSNQRFSSPLAQFFYFPKTDIGSLRRMPAFPFTPKDYFKL